MKLYAEDYLQVVGHTPVISAVQEGFWPLMNRIQKMNFIHIR
ncbi:hypothetical protein [Oribacterium sp. KHPX15]|nr:hypothetical protein [Oribacterium sp. KHPX15]